MKDRLEDLVFYKEACTLYDLCWEDCNALSGDFRGREIATQLIRSAGSIAANIKEGYGRGFGKEYPNFLRYSRASARETKGWYQRSRFILDLETINARHRLLDEIISMLVKTVSTLEERAASRN
jgi:four helix bundle protein